MHFLTFLVIRSHITRTSYQGEMIVQSQNFYRPARSLSNGKLMERELIIKQRMMRSSTMAVCIVRYYF